MRRKRRQNDEFRIGIFADDNVLTQWQAECIRQIEDLPFARIDLFIRKANSATIRSHLPVGASKRATDAPIVWSIYERLVLSRKVGALKRTPFVDRMRKVPTFELGWKAVDRGQTLEEDSRKKLNAYALDLILSFGASVPAKLASLVPYGVWSFCYGEPGSFDGTPAAFWEVHDGEPTIRVTLQRITDDGGNGQILHSGWFRTRETSYAKSLERVLRGSAHFVARALVDLRHDPNFLGCRPLVANRIPIRQPGNRAVFAMLARSTRAWFRREYRWLTRHQQWAIGIIPQPIAAIFEASKGKEEEASNVRWMPEMKGHFFADPIPLPTSSNRPIILAEAYSWKDARGHISAFQWSEEGYSAEKPVIRSKCHLSYPYSFRHGSNIYCVPESADNNEVTLYRLVGEGRWDKEKAILSGFPAVDPTIFKHEGRWWLFCTSGETGANEFLYAWFAVDLHGDWVAHPANPLKVDVRSARPAGRPFLHSGDLIRPAQDCSRGYGGGITFNRISELTPTRFAEQPVGKLRPEQGRYSTGLHTICGAADITIVDGARTAFIPNEFSRALLRVRAR